MPTATQQQQMSQAQQKAIQQRNAQNAQFMRLSYEEWGLADAQNGNTYQPGSNPLNFQIPITELAYATAITVRSTINFTYTAAGAGPTVSVTAAAPWSAIQQIEVMYGNRQILVHPYFEHAAAQQTGHNRHSTNNVAGHQSSSVQTLLYSFPSITAGANTWQFDIDVPLNRIHPRSVWGILPIYGTGTRLQVNITPAAAFVGNDPLLNCISTNGTISVTNTSSITVLFRYRDFKSMYTRQGIAPNLAGVPTVQVIQPQQINPLTAGTMIYQRINNPYEFARLQFLVIDGQSAGTFCSASNIQAFEVDRAENNSSVLRKYDSTNGGMANYYKDVRQVLEQDMDDGYLFFDAMLQNTDNPSNRNGDAYLNLTGGMGNVPQGFPAARYGVQVGTVGTVCTPRVIVYGTIINRAGIQLSS